MSDVFQEVEESLRQDRATRIWMRVRWWVIGIAAALLIATGVREYLQWQEGRAREARVQVFEAALAELDAARRDGGYEDAIAALQPLADEGNELSGMAASHLAAALLEGRGDTDGAIAALEIAMATEADPVLADAARLKIGYLIADRSSLTELEIHLEPLLARNNLTENLARELIAAKAFAEGDIAKSRAEYDAIIVSLNSTDASGAGSDFLRQRAQNALDVMTEPSVETLTQQTSEAPSR